MRPPAFPRQPAPGPRTGAALLLSLFVLIVILAVVFQIKIGTATDARVARNAVGLTKMDLAIESIVLDYGDILAQDADGAASEAGGAEADPLGGAAGGVSGEAAEEGGGNEGPVDSRRDDWAKRRRTELGGVELTVFLRPENSKYNVLSMLTENEDEAEKAFDRVVRIIDLFREGTEEDVDSGDAELMAEAMLDYMVDRADMDQPVPALLTYDEENEDRVLPLSLREFAKLEPFEEHHFRDYRDENGDVVHSLEAFLTVWSSVATRSDYRSARDDSQGAGGAGGAAPEEEDGEGEAGGGPSGVTQTETGRGGSDQGVTVGEGDQETAGSGPGAGGAGGQGGVGGGGHRINVNFAPRAVLFGLMDDRDVPARFWDELVEYRNTEDEDEVDEDAEPVYDEFGEEIVPYQYFASIEDLAELDGWNSLEPIVQAELRDLLTVESQVFSILVQARQATGSGGGEIDWTDREAIREQQESGSNLLRIVRSTVWRTDAGDGYQVVPLERWEVLDYRPYEVLDDPDEDR